VKFKLERQQEFVIGGYSPDGVNSLDAVLVGYYEGDALQFAGKVRAGLVPFVRREVLAKLKGNLYLELMRISVICHCSALPLE
jgi:ATP-dependent DNA ligase